MFSARPRAGGLEGRGSVHRAFGPARERLLPLPLGMRRNPFQSELSLLHSNYCLSVERDLKFTPTNPEMGRLTLEVFHELQQMMVDDSYSCTGAQAAFRQAIRPMPRLQRCGTFPN